MSKHILFILFLPLLLLSACGTDQSWENEKVSEVSRPILTDDVKVSWKLEGTFIQLKIMNNNGKPIEKFDINHEKLLHLIIISKDLSYFNHVHPEYKGNGMFEIRNDFPAGGEYKLIADFKPSGGNSMTKMEWVQVEGKQAQLHPVTVDQSLEKSVDGKRVTLSMDSLEANKEVTLKFFILDEKTNQPITDLEPYLGSIGHVVVLSDDGERYLHVHALEGQGSGPEALFETEFPKSGVYKIWGQFQKDNQVFTVSYVVNVR
ncbi:hypothetical protein PB1_06322 [Bacillus methanolicus PB1]|uniref:Lipoprotein n=1 Tax=Bacillus methanolicus PB1 TaxID=997296 RepID=I3E0D5_BACMT|nr:hypothetical protein [Bacillus methanolicus]EIJ79956.1 hypothetical protein PB1_06322 [Bacillus methanolicus PB1]